MNFYLIVIYWTILRLFKIIVLLSNGNWSAPTYGGSYLKTRNTRRGKIAYIRQKPDIFVFSIYQCRSIMKRLDFSQMYLDIKWRKIFFLKSMLTEILQRTESSNTRINILYKETELSQIELSFSHVSKLTFVDFFNHISDKRVHFLSRRDFVMKQNNDILLSRTVLTAL